jgi:multiple sugar transport system ATP-binding protein
MATVRLRDIRKSFGTAEVIKGVDLDIADRQLAVVVGPSGCGKSTLLRLIAGLEEITSGDLWIDGERMNDVPPAKRRLAMVFQSYALYPHMSVAENLGFSLKLARVPKETRHEKVKEAARILQIEPLLRRKPKELSGGERQRVAIGRAIVRNPRVFLFDEPLSNLDAALRVQMRLEVMRLHDELRATMLYVTHDQVEAMTMADVIIVLNAGTIEQVGTPLDVYHHPRNLFVAGFIGSPRMNFIQATVTSVGEATARLSLPGGAALDVPADPRRLRPGDVLSLGARPEHLALSEGGALRGEALVIERLGNVTFVHVSLEGGPMLTVQAASDEPVRVHDRVSVRLGGDDAHLFDGAGLAVPRVPQDHKET